MIEHKNEEDICGWKSSSWLGTALKHGGDNRYTNNVKVLLTYQYCDCVQFYNQHRPQKGTPCNMKNET